MHNSFLYLLSFILSPFSLSVLRLVPAEDVAVLTRCEHERRVSLSLFRLFTDSQSFITLLRNGHRNERLINLRAELWCWWSRNPVRAISHWRFKFSLNTRCPTTVCSKQDGGISLQDCFQVSTRLSADCWYQHERSSHSSGPLEAFSSLLAQRNCWY